MSKVIAIMSQPNPKLRHEAYRVVTNMITTLEDRNIISNFVLPSHSRPHNENITALLVQGLMLDSHKETDMIIEVLEAIKVLLDLDHFYELKAE